MLPVVRRRCFRNSRALMRGKETSVLWWSLCVCALVNLLVHFPQRGSAVTVHLCVCFFFQIKKFKYKCKSTYLQVILNKLLTHPRCNQTQVAVLDPLNLNHLVSKGTTGCLLSKQTSDR